MREQCPGDKRVQNVLDGSLARACDARQVQVTIRFHDQEEVRGSLLYYEFAPRQTGWQDRIQFVFKLHDS